MKRAIWFLSMLAAISIWPLTALAQTPGGPVVVAFGWPAADAPQQIILPNDGESFTIAGQRATAQLMRPTVGERRYAIEILYADGTSYPLELRLLPISRPATIQLSRTRPDSCSNNNLRPFETPTVGTIGSIRAAFSVRFMLARGTEANSCASWPLRAEKALHDRYCNMMTASEMLVVPQTIRDQFRADARGKADYLSAIDNCERQEGVRKTIILQAAAHDKANKLDAYIASAVLSEEAVAAESDSDLVYSQISQSVLEQQTSDLRANAAEAFGEAAVNAVDESIAAEVTAAPQ